MNKIWFKRKTYGWGWTPATWEGWVVLLVYLGLVALLILQIDKNASGARLVWSYFLPLGLLTFLLVYISWKKGESPRWQWGEKKGDTNEKTAK